MLVLPFSVNKRGPRKPQHFSYYSLLVFSLDSVVRIYLLQWCHMTVMASQITCNWTVGPRDCSIGTPKKSSRQMLWVQRMICYCLGSFCWGSGATNTNNLCFCNSCNCVAKPTSIFHMPTVCIVQQLFIFNLSSLDNHTLSRQPQQRCHVTSYWKTLRWGPVDKHILNLPGWG